MLKVLKKILHILPYNYKFKFIVIISLMLIGTILDVVGIGLIPVFINCISNPNKLINNSFAKPILLFLKINNGKELLNKGAIIIILIFLFKSFYTVGLEYVKSKFVFNCFKHVSRKLFNLYMFSPYTFHLNHNSTHLIRNVANNTYEFANNVMIPFLIVLTQGITIIGIFSLLITIEPLLTIFSFLTLGLCSGLLFLIIKNSLKKSGENNSREWINMLQIVSEGLGGFKEATVMNRKNYFVFKFNKNVSNMEKSQVYIATTNQAAKPIVEFIAVAGMMSLAILMTLQNREVVEILSTLTLFAAAAFKLIPSISQIIGQLGQIKFYNYSLDAITNAFVHKGNNLVNNLVNNFNFDNYSKLNISYNLSLNSVSYSYPNTNEVALNEITLNIKKGSVVAFVGTSGAGKTTIIDLILGLLEPLKGEVLVDGLNIKNRLVEWHNTIGYIPQHIYLSDDTIRNNIAFGISEEDISEEKVQIAVKSAMLDLYIQTLEKGLDTLVGERGVRLSGGQRQRIGIARALYNDPELLIMDEATSALDNITEQHVIQAIDKQKGKRTIIMIAHRLTTVKNCDNLFLMKNGKIEMEGKYDELLIKSEQFRNMALIN